VEDRPTPIRPRRAAAQVSHCGICGSDLHSSSHGRKSARSRHDSRDGGRDRRDVTVGRRDRPSEVRRQIYGKCEYCSPADVAVIERNRRGNDAWQGPSPHKSVRAGRRCPCRRTLAQAPGSPSRCSRVQASPGCGARPGTAGCDRCGPIGFCRSALKALGVDDIVVSEPRRASALCESSAPASSSRSRLAGHASSHRRRTFTSRSSAPARPAQESALASSSARDTRARRRGMAGRIRPEPDPVNELVITVRSSTTSTLPAAASARRQLPNDFSSTGGLPAQPPADAAIGLHEGIAAKAMVVPRISEESRECCDRTEFSTRNPAQPRPDALTPRCSRGPPQARPTSRDVFGSSTSR